MSSDESTLKLSEYLMWTQALPDLYRVMVGETVCYPGWLLVPGHDGEWRTVSVVFLIDRNERPLVVRYKADVNYTTIEFPGAAPMMEDPADAIRRQLLRLLYDRAMFRERLP